jgi:mono/diheme cytochrome c family protein
VAEGQVVFQTNCSTCHNLDSTRKVGPGLAGLFTKTGLTNGKPFTEANLIEWLRTVHEPKLPELTDAQMTALVAFLKANTSTGVPTPALAGTITGTVSTTPAAGITVTGSTTTTPGAVGTITATTAAVPSAADVTTAGSPVLAVGKQVFDVNCAGCHNLDATPKRGPGLAGLFSLPNLPNGKPVTDENVADWIHTGGSGLAGYPPMPPRPQVQGDQLTALIAYLKEATK